MWFGDTQGKAMSWQGIEGHDAIAERFRRAFVRGRIGGTYLFVGPPGIGKRTFAHKLAQVLLCEKPSKEAFAPCNACSACVQVISGTHPDLLLISKPPDRSFIPLEMLIGDRSERGTERAGLVGHLALTPFSGRYRVAIIDDADYLNLEGANALLKTLEEPPATAVLILISNSPAKQLPTIRSRSQMIRFRPLPEEIAARLLIEQGIVDNPDWARELIRLADGSLARAAELASQELWELAAKWRKALSTRRFDVTAWSDEVRGYLESAGKEAAVRRRALQQLIGLTLEFFRQALRAVVSHSVKTAATSVGEEVIALLQSTPPLTEDVLHECLESCLAAYQDVERNINQALLIDDWLLQLWQLLNAA
ncbi:DNA polymerase III delta prime subunit [Thermogutta terrifontis]|uniref:DNA polymerase III delta prime subunit n=2 Tax=Thermogutta terrifontis TaxID=1331910 RepID=A0A286RKR1_9BACT|nr:DNA polymerase III delta prime subunit [Thermogutta terrifontis]